MHALVFTGAGVVELLDVAEPEPRDGETLVTVAAAGICGSDLHGTRQVGFRRPPLVLGHEFVGVTASGRRVAVNPLLTCGQCARCLDGDSQLCQQRQLIGVHRSGGFAERVAVPETALHDLPEGLPWSVGALIEPIANAVHVERLAGGFAGRRVAVVGCGTIGMTIAQLARRSGASRIAATDLSAFRLSVISTLGADEAGHELSGEFDVVVDAVGSAPTRRIALEHLRPGGVAVFVGLQDDDAGFGAQDLVRSGKTVRGSFAYSAADFAAAVRLAPDWDVSWVTAFPLDEAVSIFDALAGGLEDPVKAVLVP